MGDSTDSRKFTARKLGCKWVVHGLYMGCKWVVNGLYWMILPLQNVYYWVVNGL